MGAVRVSPAKLRGRPGSGVVARVRPRPPGSGLATFFLSGDRPAAPSGEGVHSRRAGCCSSACACVCTCAGPCALGPGGSWGLSQRPAVRTDRGSEPGGPGQATPWGGRSPTLHPSRWASSSPQQAGGWMRVRTRPRVREGGSKARSTPPGSGTLGSFPPCSAGSWSAVWRQQRPAPPLPSGLP